MTYLKHAESYVDLVVYQKAIQLSRRIFAVSKSFTKEELYSLTDQIRRSSRSVGAQIAEAWAKRRYEKHFASKLTDADGEQQETQHWLRVAYDCGYVTPEVRDELTALCGEIGRMLNSMIGRACEFCGEEPLAVREAAAEYFVASRSDY